MSKSYIVVIEMEPGYNSCQTYPTLKEAIAAKKESFDKDESPICIYSMEERKYVWFDDEGPSYFETIANHVIEQATRS